MRFLGFVPRPGHPGGSWAFVQDPGVHPAFYALGKGVMFWYVCLPGVRVRRRKAVWQVGLDPEKLSTLAFAPGLELGGL